MAFSFFSQQPAAFWLAVCGVLFFIFAICLAGVLVRRRFSLQKEQLRAERERWALLLEANQDGIFDVNFQTGVVFFSPRWCEQLGYRPAEFKPEKATWLRRIHPEDRARVETNLEEYLARRAAVYDVEYRIRHRAGHWCWIHARAHAVWDKSGNPLRLVGSHADITARKQAAEELQASELRFRTFLDKNPVLTFFKDEAGRLLYANKKPYEKFEGNLADLVGKLDEEIWPPEMAAQIRAADQAAFASENGTECLDTFTMPDGSHREFLTTKFVFEDVGGRRVLGGIALDVTERRLAQAALRESEEQYRELFERNPLPAWIYNTDTFKIVDVNEAALAHYGWSRAEFLRLGVFDIRMPEEGQALEAELQERTKRNENTGPWQHRRKDGSTIWVEIAARDLRSGSAAMRLTLIHDVTARFEAEKNIQLAYERLEALVEKRAVELQESEIKWRALVETVPQIVWAAGPVGEAFYMSPRAAEYTGLPLSELQGSRWLEIVHPADRSRMAALWKAAIDAGTPFDAEFRLRSRSGDYRWFKSLGGPLRDGNGQVTRWIGTCTDIDDQKRNEEALESAVARRTLELAEARDRAESATRAKTQFLAAMSHEIRTPMNGVIGMANIMLDTNLTSQQRCYMDTIRSSGEALLTVINDVLDLSKIEAGRLELERTPFDLSTLIEEALELVAPQAAAKSLKLLCQVDDSIPFDLVGDPVRLRQIVLNLLSNAVKFTAEGSVSLIVSREANQNQLTMLRFAIRDTGIGLTQKQQEGLFQAFQQADLSTNRRFGGTGLGLSISKRLVEMMGGSIGVHSQMGEGSIFWFNVCLETAPAFSNLECFALKHIALVSNHPTQTPTLCSHLEAVGLRVSNYARIPQLDHTHFDLLVVDSAAVPNASDAVQLCANSKVPVLILGATADFGCPAPEGLEKAVFLSKPVRRLPLLRALQSVLEGKTPAELDAAPSSLSSNRHASVLLAEDNKINQLVARILLERMGCHVDIAENGVDACNALQHRSYDVVLMDCQMPIMSGFEATQRIRSFETSGRRTPIIALTAGVLKEERDRCYASGMDDFLSKPISAKNLEAALEKWIPIHADAQ